MRRQWVRRCGCSGRTSSQRTRSPRRSGSLCTAGHRTPRCRTQGLAAGPAQHGGRFITALARSPVSLGGLGSGEAGQACQVSRTVMQDGRSKMPSRLWPSRRDSLLAQCSRPGRAGRGPGPQCSAGWGCTSSPSRAQAGSQPRDRAPRRRATVAAPPARRRHLRGAHWAVRHCGRDGGGPACAGMVRARKEVGCLPEGCLHAPHHAWPRSAVARATRIKDRSVMASPTLSWDG